MVPHRDADQEPFRNNGHCELGTVGIICEEYYCLYTSSGRRILKEAFSNHALHLLKTELTDIPRVIVDALHSTCQS